MKARVDKKLLIEEIYFRGKKMFFTKETLDSNIIGASLNELQFLLKILSDEAETRTISRRARYQRVAGFPIPKSFDNYDFSAIEFPKKLSKEKMLSLDFIKKKEVLLMFGICGSGKTHALIALGIMACNQDLKVKFYTVSQLVMQLKKAKLEGTLDKFYKILEKQDLLCLDEFGYIPMDLEGGQLLFQVIASAYERQALILTTNLPFTSWGPLFADEQLAAAIIDRLIHYGHLIKTGENDWRLTHSLMVD
jgi:DNA replication protein DnaC